MSSHSGDWLFFPSQEPEVESDPWSSLEEQELQDVQDFLQEDLKEETQGLPESGSDSVVAPTPPSTPTTYQPSKTTPPGAPKHSSVRSFFGPVKRSLTAPPPAPKRPSVCSRINKPAFKGNNSPILKNKPTYHDLGLVKVSPAHHIRRAWYFEGNTSRINGVLKRCGGRWDSSNRVCMVSGNQAFLDFYDEVKVQLPEPEDQPIFFDPSHSKHIVTV